MKIDDIQNSYSEGLSWLLDLQITTNPEILNAIVLNIFKVSNRIKDLEFLTDQINKRLLIWIELDWWGKKFKQKEIERNVTEMLLGVLPSYKVRICYDRTLFDKAVKTVESLKHGKANTTK